MKHSILFLLMLVSGCATTQIPQMGGPPVPANLLVACPDLPLLKDDSAGALLEKLVDVANQYYACQAKDNALIQAVKNGLRNP